MSLCLDCYRPLKRGAKSRCMRCYRKAMSERNRIEAPARMRERNPMRIDSVRLKMTETLHRIGHRPKTRGGNGNPIPEPQRMIADALQWETEVIVRTGFKSGSKGRPNHYKIDVANRALLIAIEIDGGSHFSRARQAQDKRKDHFLLSKGWLVMRFMNKEILSNLEACINAIRSAEAARLPA